MIRICLLAITLPNLLLSAADMGGLSGWKFSSPRPEAMPGHHISTSEGRDGKGALMAQTAEGDHWMGCWSKTFPVEGGGSYQFEVWRKFTAMAEAKRSVVVRVLWQNEAGLPVSWEEPASKGYAKGSIPRAEAEYPRDLGLGEPQWNRFADILKAPRAARIAKVELILQWAPHASVLWSDPVWKRTEAKAKRLVRLATAHLRPDKGTLPEHKPPQFEPLIAEAGRRGADLLVLPETLTYYGTKRRMDQCAEPIPGPTTAFFGALARKHNLYLVVGMIERSGQSLYNVSVLIGPDAGLVGVYRKVCLPRGEIEAGLSPGRDYPVFATRFGKIGMMICYDGFFPEVARELTRNGAEVIAWPVWGCNPLLAAARAVENHVYVVSSTYTDPANQWMISAIYDHYGEVLAQAKQWGSIAITEVDLNQPAIWNSLGNFKAQLPSHQPMPGPQK